MGPDGGFIPTLPVQPEPIPEATPDNMICLRDCRHYVEIVSRFNAGNAKGTLGFQPRQINRFCKAIAGTDIDLTDELVSDCSDWDPISAEEIVAKSKRRQEWLSANADVDDEGVMNKDESKGD